MQGKSASLSKLALQRFKKNFWGVFSFGFILGMAFLAIFAYAFAPDNSQNANQMALPIHSKSPGFSVKTIRIPISNSVEQKSQSWLSELFIGKKEVAQIYPVEDYSFKNDTLYYQVYGAASRDLKANQFFLLNEDFKGENPQQIESEYIQTKHFWLGTDRYGRDLLSRMLVGIRVSLSIGFVAVFISLFIGISLGAIAGYFGGKVDAGIMWLINVTWSIPTLLLVIAISLALGKGFWQVFIAVGLTMWVEVARIVRGQVKSVKEMQYITAAHALGYGNFRIIYKHILPNVLAPVIVISAANFAAAILIESGLSFLGIGAQPPTPSWGAMIKDHYAYIVMGKAYLAIIPGLAIMSLVMTFMLVGNALRDALDVNE
jgi:peptide/nickel transport system permease protein